MRSRGHEARHAGLWEQVTPTTAGLLQWWFDAGNMPARRGLAFNEAQRQAILDTITRHETGSRQHRVAPPRHRIRLADDTDRMPVLLALMLWQLLNHTTARAAGLNDPRFTRHFLAVTPDSQAREHLQHALHGQPLAGGHGARDFGTADLVRRADLFMPEHHRDLVHAFVCSSAGIEATLGPGPGQDHWVVLTDQPLQTLASLAGLPQLMVFAHEAQSPGATAQGRRRLRRVVSLHGKPCMEVVFAGPADNARQPRA